MDAGFFLLKVLTGRVWAEQPQEKVISKQT